MINVRVVSEADDLKTVFSIREVVFVQEQNVPRDEEYDEFEDESTHFLALDENEKPCGTARWRFTEKGIKLERFAVLSECRGKGVGQALVKKVIQNIQEDTDSKGKTLYLHAQLPAVSLYERFGFEKIGEQFEECDIMHYKMIREA